MGAALGRSPWTADADRREAPAEQNTHLDDSLLQLIIHETRGPGLHRVCRRRLSPGTRLPLNRGPPRGCPRQSPGQLRPKRAPVGLPHAAPRSASVPRARGKNYRQQRASLKNHQVVSRSLISQAHPPGPGCQGPPPFEQAQLYCFQLCEHVHAAAAGRLPPVPVLTNLGLCV